MTNPEGLIGCGVVGFCSEHSLEASERQQGSAATGVRDWLLVESCEPWGPKAPVDSGLDPRLEQMLVQVAPKKGPLRVQLIRHPHGGGATRQVIYASGGRVMQRAFEPDALHAWAEAGGPRRDESGGLLDTEGWTEQSEPLYLVCTHGKRDACCAKKGLPIFHALDALAPGRVWQSTHLGGHRFAPTFTHLPSGLNYGRVSLDRVEGLFGALEKGQIGAPDLLRGRCDLSRAAQVGLGHLLEALERSEELGADACELLDDVKGVQTWSVAGRGHYEVVVEKAPMLNLLASCADAQPKSVEQWRLRRLEARAPG